MGNSEQIRNTFAEWSVENGTEFQIELYEKWEEYRVDFFENASMIKPVIELLPPGRPITYGCYWPKKSIRTQWSDFTKTISLLGYAS